MNRTTTVYGRGRVQLHVQPRKRGAAPLLWALGLALLLALVAHALLVGSAFADDTDAPRAEPTTRGDRAAVVDLAERYFPSELVGWAVTTAGCESSFKADARNQGYDRILGVYYDFRSYWQVDAVTWAAEAYRRFGGDLSDPEVNAAMAAWIATTYGTGHWPVCGRNRGGW